jgi:hypothetical protein
MLLRPGASFELARNLQIGSATLGEVFTFCSGLYFRGKMAYSHRFAAPPPRQEGVLVITPSRGLLPPDEWVDPAVLAEFAQVDIQAGGARFAEPLIASATSLATLPAEVVLLGSIATSKYVDVLLPILGEKLLFPSDFVGRGDMSRGALMLRAARHGHELPYIPVLGARRKGRRAPSMLTMELRKSPPSPALRSAPRTSRNPK